MSGGDPPQSPPVDAVGSEADRPVEHQAVRRLLHWPVGEHRAVENLLRDVRVASDDDTRLAEAEGHEPPGSAGRRGGGDAAVGEGRHEAHAAEQRETFRSGNH